MINEAAPPCRLERVKPSNEADCVELDERGIDIYLDVCHNEQGVACVLEELTTRSDKPLVIVFGTSIGKKVGTMLKVIE